MFSDRKIKYRQVKNYAVDGLDHYNSPTEGDFIILWVFVNIYINGYMIFTLSIRGQGYYYYISTLCARGTCIGVVYAT